MERQGRHVSIRQHLEVDPRQDVVLPLQKRSLLLREQVVLGTPDVNRVKDTYPRKDWRE